MPLLLIRTNVPKSEIGEEMFKELDQMISDLLNRSTKGICIIVQADQYMSFGGTTEPCAACIVQDFEHFGVEENKKISAALMTYLLKYLKIDKRRMFLEFAPVVKENVGFAGTTFHQFFGPTAIGYNPNSIPDKTFSWPEKM